MRRASSCLVTAVAALAALACPTPARADDKTEIESILSEHVVSTASTNTERASVAPALSTTLTSDDLRALGIRSLAEAIDFLSLGVVTSDPLRAPDIGSRGVLFANDDGKHFLLLVNGHAINDPLYGAARFDEGAGVPIDLIDHVEVVVGPGSVLYGSNAMLGVINVITKTTADYKGGHVLGDFEVGRSYRAGAGAGVTFDLLGAPSEVTAGVEYYGRYGPPLTFPEVQLKTLGNGPFSRIQWGGGLPTNTWGGTVQSAYFAEAPSALVRLRTGDFEVNVFGNMYRRGIPYSTSETGVQFDDAQSFELDRAIRIDVKHQATLSTLAQLSSRIYADSFDYQRRLDQDGATGCLNAAISVCQYYDAGAAQWAGVEERLALNWFHDQTFVTTIGTDARIRWVRTKEDMIDVATGQALAPTIGRIDETGGIVSPYAQQTYSPTSWLDFNAGARLDVDSRYSPVVSPRGAIALRTSDKTTFKVIYSQAFRAPTYSETSIVDYKVAPSPDLQPETVRSVEASVEQRFGTQRVLFGVFRSWWESLIESGPVSLAELTALQMAHMEPPIVGNLSQFSNVAGIDNYGWNGGWEGSLSERRVRYGLNATGAFTRLQQGGQSVYPLVAPQVFGNAHVAYSFGEGGPTAALAVYGMGPRAADRSAPTGGTLPAAPALADLRLAVTGRVPLLPHGFGYSVTADYTTADHGPYMAGPDFRTFASVLTADGATLPSPSYAPIDQFRVMFGLRFDFLTGTRAVSAGGVP
jgi:outer membrane receptor for ferrienterochelin and colicins